MCLVLLVRPPRWTWLAAEVGDMMKHRNVGTSLFIGMKDASGEVKDVTHNFKVNSWGVVVRFRKTFEGTNILTAQRANGWALNWFLDVFPKRLYNLHYLRVDSGTLDDDRWAVVVEAEYYLTGLTREDDVEKWVKDRVEGLRTLQVLCGGYQYYARSDCWDEAEIIGEIDVS